VFFHHPPWTNAWSADYYLPFSPYFLYQGSVDMRTELVPLFEDYNVDFVLNGHSHCYQRGEMNGVKYIISGGAGSASIDFNTNSNAPNIDTEIYTNQYVRFNVDGDTVRYVSIDNSGVTIDSVTTIKLNTVQPAPVVTYLGGELWSTQGETYTWFLDGVQILGVTTQSFVPTQLGTYHVEITTTSGCTISSEPFVLDNLKVDSIEEVEFKVYPNPTNGKITIASNSVLSNGMEIQITNAMGKVIFKDLIDGNDSDPYTVDLSDAPKGMYFLSARSSSKTFTKLIVLQ
jgi:hypothetical protein